MGCALDQNLETFILSVYKYDKDNSSRTLLCNALVLHSKASPVQAVKLGSKTENSHNAQWDYCNYKW